MANGKYGNVIFLDIQTTPVYKGIQQRKKFSEEVSLILMPTLPLLSETIDFQIEHRGD